MHLIPIFIPWGGVRKATLNVTQLHTNNLIYFSFLWEADDRNLEETTISLKSVHTHNIYRFINFQVGIRVYVSLKFNLML